MATLHFVKDGKTESGKQESLSFPVDLEHLVKTLHPPKPLWSKDHPVFDANHRTTGFEPYRHVVVEVDEPSDPSPFDKPGFYILEMTVQEVTSRMQLTGESNECS